mmetsp:Transcript_4749/g.11956  ORF Transcript_4749/g.11956 Transcript_4749/m.11956 type:complete len:387 (+) Transcript_4749:1471-2631(+)
MFQLLLHLVQVLPGRAAGVCGGRHFHSDLELLLHAGPCLQQFFCRRDRKFLDRREYSDRRGEIFCCPGGQDFHGIPRLFYSLHGGLGRFELRLGGTYDLSRLLPLLRLDVSVQLRTLFRAERGLSAVGGVPERHKAVPRRSDLRPEFAHLFPGILQWPRRGDRALPHLRIEDAVRPLHVIVSVHERRVHFSAELAEEGIRLDEDSAYRDRLKRHPTRRAVLEELALATEKLGLRFLGRAEHLYLLAGLDPADALAVGEREFFSDGETPLDDSALAEHFLELFQANGPVLVGIDGLEHFLSALLREIDLLLADVFRQTGDVLREHVFAELLTAGHLLEQRRRVKLLLLHVFVQRLREHPDTRIDQELLSTLLEEWSTRIGRLFHLGV